MTTIVIPFRAGGKSRLPESIRAELALAMLEDVVTTACDVGYTAVVTDDPTAATMARRVGASLVADPGGGQGAAVAAALAEATAPCVVVNADVPAVTADEIALLLDAARAPALALVEAVDGTTNALALPRSDVFAPLYGPGSAARFREHAATLGLPLVEVEAPGIAADVDTLADLDRIAAAAGPTTRRLLSLVG